MSPENIKEGKIYRNRGKGNTLRKVLKVAIDLEPPAFSTPKEPGELIVRYIQIKGNRDTENKEQSLYLRSFASWAGGEVNQ